MSLLLFVSTMKNTTDRGYVTTEVRDVVQRCHDIVLIVCYVAGRHERSISSSVVATSNSSSITYSRRSDGAQESSHRKQRDRK